MKRLRLIKPWNLRTQPQRLAAVTFEFSADTVRSVPCAGPQAFDEDAVLLRGADSGFCNVRFSDGATRMRTAAPGPRAIFAPVPNERFRS